MSGKNNVNPDHYKVAGRDRQDDIARARRETPPTGKSRKKGHPSNLIPGAAPARETPAPTRAETRPTGDNTRRAHRRRVRS